jgi:hypothetical protein
LACAESPPYRSTAVPVVYHPPQSVEFPSDNPALYQGARWVCRGTLEPARAVIRARRVPIAEGVAAPPDDACAPEPARREAPRLPMLLSGPLQLDLGRLVLAHRVENVPPPPDFLFKAVTPAAAVAQPVTAIVRWVEPVQTVLVRPADRRVTRGVRVDVAPRTVVDSGPPSCERRSASRRGPLVTRVLAPCPLADEDELRRAISELEDAFADQTAVAG